MVLTIGLAMLPWPQQKFLGGGENTRDRYMMVFVVEGVRASRSYSLQVDRNKKKKTSY
jgi:hypothetical protein